MNETFAVAACMKNEGPFIIEWVSNYLALGFSHAFIITNDCDDGTDLIADRLSEIGPVTHLRNSVPPGGFAQESGMALLKATPELGTYAWLLHCDADEFLYLHQPDPDIGRFVQELPPCDAIAFDWRYAGTTLSAWPGGLVVENCPFGSAKISKAETFSKTMFRHDLFGFFSDHMPKKPIRPDVVVLNSRGDHLPSSAMLHRKKSRYVRNGAAHISWERAELRHYALRSKEAFAVKALRGFGINPNPGKYQVSSPFWKIANRREIALDQNARWLTRLKHHVAEFLSDDVLSRLQTEAIQVLSRKAQQLQKLRNQQ